MRYGQIDFVVAIYAVLEVSQPMPLYEICMRANELLGEDFCERTVRRGLKCLERLGVVEHAGNIYRPGNNRPLRTWVRISDRAFFEAAKPRLGATA